MRPRFIQIFVWQVILVCAVTVHAAGQIADAIPSPGSEIEIVRLLIAAESDYQQKYGRYATLAQLRESGQLQLSAVQSGENLSAFQSLNMQAGHEPVTGFSLDLMVASDGAAFKLSLTPKSRACAAGWFTDNTGTLYTGKPVGCESAESSQPPEPTSPSNTRTLPPAGERDWAPPDVDQDVPLVKREPACPLSMLLTAASKHAEELVENLQRFSAKERIEDIEFGKNGKQRNYQSGIFNYVAEIEQSPSGALWVEEYRQGGSPKVAVPLADTGTAAFALIFHPRKASNFEFQCQGMTDLRGVPSWLVHFQESADPAKSFHSILIGKTEYPLRFKGRAWIAAESQQVLRLETDLVGPIPQIALEREHLAIAYAPVEFKSHNTQLWLPESAKMYIGYRGHRYERVHDFSKFELFWIDTAQSVKGPEASPGGSIK